LFRCGREGAGGLGGQGAAEAERASGAAKEGVGRGGGKGILLGVLDGRRVKGQRAGGQGGWWGVGERWWWGGVRGAWEVRRNGDEKSPGVKRGGEL